MLAALHKWLYWGVDSQMDYTEKRKVLSTNAAAIFGIFSLLVLNTIFLSVGNKAMFDVVIFHIPFYLLFASIPWLNHKGWSNFTRWFFSFLFLASVLVPILVSFGSFLHTQNYLLLCAISPIVLFPTRQWRAIVLIFLTSLVIYLLIENIGINPRVEIFGMSKSTVQGLRGIYDSSVGITLFIFIWFIELTSEQQEKKLQTLSVTDKLTDLPNRRFFEISFNQEVAKCRSEKGLLNLAILDIDHFKHINDTYGHDVGDKILINLSQNLRNTIRAGNIVSRIGGEEFAVLIPKNTLSEAAVVAERLRQAIEANDYRLNDQLLKTTISIGLVSVDCELPIEYSIKLADQALYSAKRAGRNRVMVFDQNRNDVNTLSLDRCQ